MTETTDTGTTPDEGTTPPPAHDTGQQAPADEQQQQENPNAEAARYRTQLRAAEAERDTLAERLTTYQRRAAESTIADILDEPGDLFEIGGVDLADYLDEDGNINSTDLQGAAAALVDQRPKLGKNYARYGSGLPQHRNWGQGGGLPPQPDTTSWSDVIKP
ncbi:hypothetical protein [Gordonia sp. p3-SID1431]|uniref:hypothetical protein n=1 Tax=Gordonia sp. p3-SID1431 TaxID=2916159 RepID=UPI0021A71A62|nr:hypothetical protein [Gordonia sp. p3-SID1431]MCT1352233.1 hypothetical protein [Gordonia sp. p3-SID1431]